MVAAVAVLGAGCTSHAGPSTAPTTSAGAPSTTAVAETTPEPRPGLDRGRYSTTRPASIWVVVNKKHPIHPLGYRPPLTLVRSYQVATAAAGPLTHLLVASDRRGLGFKIASAFRSYAYQQGLYASLVATDGQQQADRVSARPGYSEHQTGLAVDLVTPASPGCDFDACFAGTPGGRWLAHHAWEYGFVIRYGPGTAAITGYSPEPWHLRYVGRALAAELRRTHSATLEEFFGVTGGDYPQSGGR